MIWWFHRGGQFLRIEASQTAHEIYKLVVVYPDRPDRAEYFADETAMTDRQIA